MKTILGLPYAEKPVGERRFRSAVMCGYDEAKALGKQAPCSLQPKGGEIIGSEDCLYLNVYIPDEGELACGGSVQRGADHASAACSVPAGGCKAAQNAASDCASKVSGVPASVGTFKDEASDCENKPLPILFFIHGGNNQTGSAESIRGDALCKRLGCVVVTVTYRLNALGWLRLPCLPEKTGNLGLTDLACALDFVKENAVRWGADPDNITAAGYSSGARDILCMCISPAFEGKFNKVITFSGGQTTADPDEATEIYANAIAKLAVEDGKFSAASRGSAAKDNSAFKTASICSVEQDLSSFDAAKEFVLSPSGDTLDWLMNIDAKRLAALMPDAAIRMKVFPHLLRDGVMLPEEGFSVKEAWGRSLPKMCLSGAYEFVFHMNADPYFKAKAAANGPDSLAKDPEYLFSRKYGSALFGYINSEKNAAYFENVYAGRCFWGLDPDVTDEVAAMRIGGAHGLDLDILTGGERKVYAVTDNVFTDKNKPGRRALADAYAAYIRSFMKSGKPCAEGLPEWHKCDEAAPSIMQFDADCDSSKEAQPNADAFLTHTIMNFDADCENAIVRESSNVTVLENVLEEIKRDESLGPDRKHFVLTEILNERFFSEELDEMVKKFKL